MTPLMLLVEMVRHSTEKIFCLDILLSLVKEFDALNTRCPDDACL